MKVKERWINDEMATDQELHTFIKTYRVFGSVLHQSNSKEYLPIPFMTITPDSPGKYSVMYNAICTNSNNGKYVYLALFKNGIMVTDSEMYHVATAGRPIPVSGEVDIEVNGTSDVIELHMKTDANTAMVYNRSLRLMRTGV